jgi:DNA topoisomerase-3
VTHVPQAKLKKKLSLMLKYTKCKKVKLMIRKTAVGCCNFKECGFKIPFEILGKKIN